MERHVSQIREPKEPDCQADHMSGQPQMMDGGPKLTASDAIQYLKEVKSRLTSEKYIEFLNIMKDFREHSIDIPAVKAKLIKLFRGDTELLLGLNIFLPKESRIIFPKEDESSDAVTQLLQKIKMGLQDDNNLYKSFLGYLNLYRMGNMSSDEVHKEVVDLLQDRKDLITEFTNFLPHCHVHSSANNNTRNVHSSSPSTTKRVLDQSGEAIPQETNASHGEKAGQIVPDHEKAPVRSNKENPRCQEKGKRKRSSTGGKLIPGSKSSLELSKHKKKAKPFPNLDLSNCKRCTPSYRAFPRDYPIPEASNRTEMYKQVLNDHLFTFYYERKGHSFKPSLKNEYEEILYEHEDERFELDMSIELITITIKQAEELMRKINDTPIKKRNRVYPLEDYFTSSSLRCIAKIYGDHGLNMVKELRENVSRRLPEILLRLKQKQKEGMEFRVQLNKRSGQIFAKNHQLSLDHHGFYLKQEDSKILSDTVLLAEINKISDARSKEDKLHQLPDLELKYSDIDIHEELFLLVKLSSAKICSSKELDKALKIWTNFVEPMFGVQSQPRSILDRKHITDMSHHAAKNGSIRGIKDGQIISSSDSVTTGPKGNHEQVGNNDYLEFMTNMVLLSPIVDLEKGGFAACMYDQMEIVQCNTPNDVTDQNCHIKHTEGALGNDTDVNTIHVFYGDNAFYIFLRLHQALYSRLLEAKQCASVKWKGLNDATPNDSYAKFLDLLHDYLANKEKYKNERRKTFLTWAGLIFSIERLINKLSKKLLAIAMDEVDNKLLDLLANEKLKESGRFVDEVYCKNASAIVDDNKIFRFEHLLVPNTEGQKRLTISQINFVKSNMRQHDSRRCSNGKHN